MTVRHYGKNNPGDVPATVPEHEYLDTRPIGSTLRKSGVEARIQGTTSQHDPPGPLIGDEEAQALLSKEPQSFVDTEKGWQGYCVCLGAFFALLPPSRLLNTIGTFQAYLGNRQLPDASQQKISWIFSVYPYLFMFGGVQVGPMFDAYVLWPLFIPGCTGFTIAMIAFSFCTEFYQFMLAYGILGGVSGSLVWTTSVTVIGHWFYHRRAVTTGIVLTSGPIGGIIFPLVFERLAPTLGFADAVRVLVCISIVSFIIGIAFIRPRSRPTRKLKWESNFRYFGDTRFTLTILGMFVIKLAVLIPPAYLTTYALAKGVETSLSYQLLAVLNVAQIPGRALPGFIADRCGRFNTMVLTSLPCAIVILTVWYEAGDSVPAIVAFAILFGLLSGTAHSLTAVCISQLCTTEEYGGVYGTAYYVVSLSYLVEIPIAGMTLDDKETDFGPLILYCGWMYMAAASIFVMARLAGTGLRLRAVY